jgi:hypothetical protein
MAALPDGVGAGSGPAAATAYWPENIAILPDVHDFGTCR